MSENLTYRTLVSFTEAEKEKYQKLASVKGLPLAGLVRLALEEYARKNEVVAKDDLAGLVSQLETKITARFDAIQERLEKMPSIPQADANADFARVAEMIETLAPVETSQLVKVFPLLTRNQITNIAAALVKQGTIALVGNKWVKA